jgi:hypothetical protein
MPIYLFLYKPMACNTGQPPNFGFKTAILTLMGLIFAHRLIYLYVQKSNKIHFVIKK